MGRTESPNLKNDYERACGWYGHFNKSEMALFSECTDRYAQNMLDTADIVREAIFRQSSAKAQIRVNAVTGQKPPAWLPVHRPRVLLAVRPRVAGSVASQNRSSDSDRHRTLRPNRDGTVL